ncbi:MAG: sialate O-acetylesterase [Oscillospiraceae bacterium]|jgi:hypothetical protein
MDAFLLMGRSNMAGRGKTSEVLPIRDARIFMLRNGRWQPMTEPIHWDRPFAGVGLAASFAEEYVKAFKGEAGLIPCADGGTKIEEWQPGEIHYDHAVMQTKLALRTSRLCGVPWHQGESDSDRLWTPGLTRFWDLFHAPEWDLALYHTPVVLGELGGFLQDYPEGADHYEAVNAALQWIAASRENLWPCLCG